MKVTAKFQVENSGLTPEDIKESMTVFITEDLFYDCEDPSEPTNIEVTIEEN